MLQYHGGLLLPLPPPATRRQDLPRWAPGAAHRCHGPASASHPRPGCPRGASSSAPRAAPAGSPAMGSSLPNPVVMPLGHARVSENEPRVTQRTCCGWGPLGAVLGEMRPRRVGGCPAGPGTGNGGGGWAGYLGMHAALVGTEPRLGLAEAWAGGVLQRRTYSLPRPRGHWQAVRQIKNREKIPLGVGKEGAGLGLRQGEGRGGRPRLPPGAPSHSFVCCGPHLTPDPRAGSGSVGPSECMSLGPAASVPLLHIGRLPPSLCPGIHCREEPAGSRPSEGRAGPSLLGWGLGVRESALVECSGNTGCLLSSVFMARRRLEGGEQGGGSCA